MMWFQLFIVLLSAIWVEWPPLWKLLPARLAIRSHSLLSIFNFYLFPFFDSRSGLVSFQTDQSIWCVLVAFLTRPNLISKYYLGTYDNLPAQYTTIFHVKMLISHDNMKHFLPILLKQ